MHIAASMIMHFAHSGQIATNVFVAFPMQVLIAISFVVIFPATQWSVDTSPCSGPLFTKR